jgi:hypothetical protein
MTTYYTNDDGLKVEMQTYEAEWQPKNQLSTNLTKICFLVTTDDVEEIQVLSWEDLVGEIGLDHARDFDLAEIREVSR